jgi:hypothetical protein
MLLVAELSRAEILKGGARSGAGINRQCGWTRRYSHCRAKRSSSFAAAGGRVATVDCSLATRPHRFSLEQKLRSPRGVGRSEIGAAVRSASRPAIPLRSFS